MRLRNSGWPNHMGTARFNAPFRADFTGKARDLTRGWNWSGKTQLHNFDLRAWGGGGALGQISGTLAGPLTAGGIRWLDPESGVDVRVARVSVDVALRPLPAGRVAELHQGQLVQPGPDL